LLLALSIASTASAQSIQATAALSLTDGLARPEAYVPVTLKVTNTSGDAIEELLISSGGPVDTVVPCPLAPGESTEKTVPVYFAGGDLRLAVTPRTSGGRDLEPITISPPAVRPLPADTGLLGVPEGDPEPSAQCLKELPQGLNLQSMRVLRLSRQAMAAVCQCGMLDAIMSSGMDDPRLVGHALRLLPEGYYYTGLIRSPRWPNMPPPNKDTLYASWVCMPQEFPPGVEAAVQPEAYDLFAARVWPAEDRLRLWVGLGLFALAAVVLAILVPRHRPLLAAVLFVALSAAALCVIWFSGEVRRATITEARVFYLCGYPSAVGGAMENLSLLQARGGAVARLESERPAGVPPESLLPLPLPTLSSSEQMLQPLAALRFGDAPAMETDRPQLIVRTLMLPVEFPFYQPLANPTLDKVGKIAARSDVVKVLLASGGQAADASGRRQTLDAWAVEWQASDDPNMAFAGRSLAWWDKTRRQGDGPVLLAWFLDPLPGADETHVRLPALMVYEDLGKW
jgi:hypothetical protein